jgi:ribosome-associated toxin RatA of RatAB toxin-antitoxin module
MTVINRSALVPFSAERMFELVNDVEAYPQFMEGCVGATVLARGDDWMEARLELAKGRMRYGFTTRNRLTPHTEIDLTLVEGPFDYFNGRWEFHALAPQASKVTLHLEFELAGRLLDFAARSLFGVIANQQVDQLVRRAHALARPGAST